MNKIKLVVGAPGYLFEGKPCEISLIKPKGWVQIYTWSGSLKSVRSTAITLPDAVPPPPTLVGEPPIDSQETPEMATRKTTVAARKIVNAKVDLSKYTRNKTKEGRTTFDVGDEVATKLRGMTLGEIYEYAAKVLDVSVRSLKDKYSHLNAGQTRMNLGNRIRGAARAKAKAKEAKKAA